MTDTPAQPTQLLKTPFHDLHVKLGAKMVDFAGWSMPLSYTGITDEHMKCRTSGGFFDVSHMGRLKIDGPDAARLLSRTTTRDATAIKPGVSRYGFVTNSDGGTIDDVIVSRLPDGSLGMVCNASNRAAVLQQLRDVRTGESIDAEIHDTTELTAMAALQGPNVIAEMQSALGGGFDEDPSTLKKFGCLKGELMGMPIELYRSGYTGEDGYELVMSADAAKLVGDLGGDFLTKGPIYACGLGARDTLRIEAALPLYGHELSTDVDPISAGFGWAVGKEHDFIGSDAIRQIAGEGPKKRLVGLELDSRRTARQGATVLEENIAVGEVTSGCLSPTLGKSIAMAYVAEEHIGLGTVLGVDFKREVARATVVPLPFYKRP